MGFNVPNSLLFVFFFPCSFSIILATSYSIRDQKRVLHKKKFALSRIEAGFEVFATLQNLGRKSKKNFWKQIYWRSATFIVVNKSVEKRSY